MKIKVFTKTYIFEAPTLILGCPSRLDPDPRPMSTDLGHVWSGCLNFYTYTTVCRVVQLK